MPDDIAHWKFERDRLQEQLNGLESSVIQPESLPLILRKHACSELRHASIGRRTPARLRP
jgi:hypothetical protein